jgi:hypothetical protein
MLNRRFLGIPGVEIRPQLLSKLLNFVDWLNTGIGEKLRRCARQHFSQALDGN